MNRRDFLYQSALLSGAALFPSLSAGARKSHAAKAGEAAFEEAMSSQADDEISADLVIAGAGLGGLAAAMSACRNGLRVVITEETGWIGGQVSQQGVPPDENQWIETSGAPSSYHDFRRRVRDFYRRNYPLTDAARANTLLNPGGASVSRISHEPRVAVAVLYEMLMPYLSNGLLTLLLHTRAVSAATSGDRVEALTVENTVSGQRSVLRAPFFADATELGDLLPLSHTEFVTGTESQAQTGEIHAPSVADPDNVQAFTLCFALDYVDGAHLVIDRPREYSFWHDYIPQLTPAWPGKLLSLDYSIPNNPVKSRHLPFEPERANDPGFNLWTYRRIIDKRHFEEGAYASDVTIVNWPQNDFMLGNLIGASSKQRRRILEQARQLNLSLLYWLQTEAPHAHDDGQGWPGLRLRTDVFGTPDGMAPYPYVRESRRIRARFTLKEEHVGKENIRRVYGTDHAPHFSDSVGIGYYHLDLHPSTRGVNYIDTDAVPFEIPLGALLPVRMENLLPACKNIGTTHISNGCYRLHPVEWGIGEAVGLLVAFATKHHTLPAAVREQSSLLSDFQTWIGKQGVSTRWKF